MARRSAMDLFKLRGSQRDPQPLAARMAQQFIERNRGHMAKLDVYMEQDYDGAEVALVIHSGSAVGAIPLISPTTAQADYGLVVQPRFPWAGIGPMLAEMSWRVSPTPLRLPLLRRSERRVPVWVLSFMILVRLKALLDSLDRRFEIAEETRSAPRGRVDWTAYATRSLPRANFLAVPCLFPDLRDDRLLKGAIRHTVEKQLRALESQKEQGAFVNSLTALGQQLLCRVQTVPIYVPSVTIFGSWMQRPMRTEKFVDGMQAIEWTIEERGLAGLSDLAGIPWTMRMDQFFEAWVETVFQLIAQQTGARVKVGRKRETTHAINWDPPYLGSQKSLAPDLWLEWEGCTLIVDAKYKRHWEELQKHSWANIEDQMREHHRADLLQVLAYANLARTPRVITCLAYPCSTDNWVSHRDGARLLHQAEITSGLRSVQLWLTGVPMSAAVEPIATPLAEQIRSALS